MRRAGIVLILFFVLVIAGGCATAGRNADLENQGLRNQLTLLESQLRLKDEEIIRLNEELARSTEQFQAQVKVRELALEEPFVRPSVKEVQAALRNAGYKVGRIDGVMGKKTRAAVRAFQAANGLPVNGKVGKKTWELLKVYLQEKSSAAEPAATPKDIG